MFDLAHRQLAGKTGSERRSSGSSPGHRPRLSACMEEVVRGSSADKFDDLDEEAMSPLSWPVPSHHDDTVN